MTRRSQQTVAGTLYDAKYGAKYKATQTAILISISGRKYANSSGIFPRLGGAAR
ncbi:MAG: hypothetical protein NC911_08675 [Candidatus Omnitrophica bacterium]|nr:hypothetical protein [Candidatus Omnitrophota bacterium]